MHVAIVAFETGLLRKVLRTIAGIEKLGIRNNAYVQRTQQLSERSLLFPVRNDNSQSGIDIESKVSNRRRFDVDFISDWVDVFFQI